MRKNFMIHTHLLTVLLCSSVSLPVRAIDYVSVDPLWEKAVIDGTNKYKSEISTQTTKMREIAALQTTMALHFNAVKVWQEKYNSYLKTTRGYAEALKAGTVLYAEAIKTIHNLIDLQKAMSRNPEGIAATLSMNNLYVETVAEFIKTFRMLKFAVAGQGMNNDDKVPLPAVEPNITPGCVIATVTIANNSSKEIVFDGKICFILYGTLADGSYTGYFRQKGICTGNDYAIPAGGSKAYTVVFEDNGQGPNEVIGMPFAESGQTGSFDSNNCIYIGGSGYTCKNQSSSSTFQRGGSYSMVVESDFREWTNGGADGHSMLTGKERTDMLWSLVDRMDELNAKIRKLILSVAYYRVSDIWAFYTRGMVDRDKGRIAGDCLERWKRIQTTMRILN